jgi:hypothetical protein
MLPSSKSEITRVGTGQQVEKSDETSSATLRKNPSSTDVGPVSPVKGSSSVAFRSDEQLKKDEGKIEGGKLNISNWQKVANFFTNIGVFFQNISIGKENTAKMATYDQKVEQVTAKYNQAVKEYPKLKEEATTHFEKVTMPRYEKDVEKAQAKFADDNLTFEPRKAQTIEENKTKVDCKHVDDILKPNPHREGTREHGQFEALKAGFMEQCAKEFSPENSGGTDAINTFTAKTYKPTEKQAFLDDAKALQTKLYDRDNGGGFGPDRVCVNGSFANEKKFKQGIEELETALKSGNTEEANKAITKINKGLEGLKGDLLSNLGDTFGRFKRSETYEQNAKQMVPEKPVLMLPEKPKIDLPPEPRLVVPTPPKLTEPIAFKPWKIWE